MHSNHHASFTPASSLVSEICQLKLNNNNKKRKKNFKTDFLNDFSVYMRFLNIQTGLSKSDLTYNESETCIGIMLASLCHPYNNTKCCD